MNARQTGVFRWIIELPLGEHHPFNHLFQETQILQIERTQTGDAKKKRIFLQGFVERFIHETL